MASTVVPPGLVVTNLTFSLQFTLECGQALLKKNPSKHIFCRAFLSNRQHVKDRYETPT